jgi:hypothetical protein
MHIYAPIAIGELQTKHDLSISLLSPLNLLSDFLPFKVHKTKRRTYLWKSIQKAKKRIS